MKKQKFSLLALVILTGCSIPSFSKPPLVGNDYASTTLHFEKKDALTTHFENADLGILWSPSGKYFVIQNLSYTDVDSNKKHLLLSIYEADSGRKLSTFSQHDIQANRYSMSWSADETSLHLLHHENNNFMSLYQYDLTPSTSPSTSASSERKVFIPESLRNLSTHDLTRTTIGPNGTHVALHRELKDKEAEILVFDLEQNHVKVWGKINTFQGMPRPVWRKDGKALFQLTTNAQSQKNLLQLESTSTKELWTFSAKTTEINMSPDQTRIMFKDDSLISVVNLQNQSVAEFWTSSLSALPTVVNYAWSGSEHLTVSATTGFERTADQEEQLEMWNIDNHSSVKTLNQKSFNQQLKSLFHHAVEQNLKYQETGYAYSAGTKATQSIAPASYASPLFKQPTLVFSTSTDPHGYETGYGSGYETDRGETAFYGSHSGENSYSRKESIENPHPDSFLASTSPTGQYAILMIEKTSSLFHHQVPGMYLVDTNSEAVIPLQENILQTLLGYHPSNEPKDSVDSSTPIVTIPHHFTLAQ